MQQQCGGAGQLASGCNELWLSSSSVQAVKGCAVPKCAFCSPGNPYKCLICQKSFEVALRHRRMWCAVLPCMLQ